MSASSLASTGSGGSGADGDRLACPGGPSAGAEGKKIVTSRWVYLPVNIATKTTIIIIPNIMKSTASQSGKNVRFIQARSLRKKECHRKAR